MIRFFFCVAFIFYVPVLMGQTYRAPSKIFFANMELNLSENLRREIQAEADALSRNPKYLNIKLDRAKLYFPIIERIFREEKLPDDFKYLVLQESALIPDAVSTSHAVGFWQFKKETAQEMGLRVDRMVDERMNIVSSTRSAARYLKSHNFYFDNWLYALLGYYAGRGGAEKIADKKNYGAKSMYLDHNLHWYLKKFLAHKVVFEKALHDYPSPGVYLHEFASTNKSLKEVASDFSVGESEVFEYNKWLKSEKAPMDKEYTVIVPLKGVPATEVAEVIGQPTERAVLVESRHSDIDIQAFPEIREYEGHDSYHIKINRKKGVVSRSDGDDLRTLAAIGNIDMEKFLRFNDLKPNHQVKTGLFYYTRPKRNKAKTHYHVLQPGEDLWSVSQKYGIKLNKLREKNRLGKNEDPEPGRVLWLRFIRPRTHPIEYREVAYRPEETIARESIGARPETERLRANHNVSNTPEKSNRKEEPAKEETPFLNEEHRSDTVPGGKVNVEEKEVRVEEMRVEEKYIDSDPPIKNIDEHSDNETIIHVVKQGETLYSISRTYEIPLSTLMALNQLGYGDTLYIGQEVIIKNQAQKTIRQIEQNSDKSYTYHKVAPGETLYRIARQYNITIRELMEWNNKTDFNLSVGEILRVSE